MQTVTWILAVNKKQKNITISEMCRRCSQPEYI